MYTSPEDTSRQTLYGLLDAINQRPQFQQLGQRQGPSLWEQAQGQPQPQATAQQVLPSAQGMYGGSTDMTGGDPGGGMDVAGAVADSSLQGALGGLFSANNLGQSIAQYGMNPGMVAANMGLNAVATNYGFDQNPGAKAAKALGTMAASALGMGPLSMAGGLLGQVGLDAAYDGLDMRSDERGRDFAEDNVGYLAGRSLFTNRDLSPFTQAQRNEFADTIDPLTNTYSPDLFEIARRAQVLEEQFDEAIMADSFGTVDDTYGPDTTPADMADFYSTGVLDTDPNSLAGFADLGSSTTVGATLSGSDAEWGDMQGPSLSGSDAEWGDVGGGASDSTGSSEASLSGSDAEWGDFGGSSSGDSESNSSGDSMGGGDSGGDGGGDGGGSVLCTVAFNNGMLDEETYFLDSIYGKSLPEKTLKGYQRWAKPLAKYLEKSPLTLKIIVPIIKSWANEMASRLDSTRKGNMIGRLISMVGEPICNFLGRK